MGSVCTEGVRIMWRAPLTSPPGVGALPGQGLELQVWIEVSGSCGGAAAQLLTSSQVQVPHQAWHHMPLPCSGMQVVRGK